MEMLRKEVMLTHWLQIERVGKGAQVQLPLGQVPRLSDTTEALKIL